MTDTARPGVLLAAPAARTRDLLAEHLSALGFAVRTAGDGVQAFDVYFRHAGGVDAVVVDADLPDLPGSAFVGRFRHHFPGVPVFALTDDPFGQSVGELADAGAVVIAKPVHLRQFAETLRAELAVPSVG